MPQETTLAKDQPLRGKSNFNEWKLFILTTAKIQGIEDFLEDDIISHLNDEFFVYIPNGNEPINRVITDILNNLNLPIPGQESRPVRENNDAPENVNNNALEPLLDNRTKRLIIKEAIKMDAELMLLILKNIDEKIVKEISRLTNSYRIMEKLKGKYGNNNADMEYWLKILKSLKPKNKNEVIKMLDQAKEIFVEMEEVDLGITNKEKLKYLYNILTDDYKNIVQFDLNSDADEYLDTLKRIISARSYVENWDDIKEKDEDDDPMDLDYLSKRKRTTKLNKKPSSSINNKKNKHKYKKDNKSYCHICDMNGHSTKECHFNLKNKENNIKNQHNNKKGRQNQQQEKKSLNYLVNSRNYNDYRNNSTPKYTKNEDYSDNASNYDENFDFEDARALMYQRKQNNKYINLLEVTPNNNKHTHDFDNIYNKSIDFINHSNVITDDVTWFYDTGAGEHVTNDKSLLVNFKYESIKLCCANGSICQF